MGPPSEDDGKDRMRGGRRPHLVASMGPPSEDDGKDQLAFPRVSKSSSSLQWGRRPRTTERSHRQ